MQFTQGATVLTADGKKAGHVDRVVLNPKTNEVTHIVIHKGLLLSEDKVVPMNLIASADDHQVKLRANGDQLDHLPNFQELHYVLVNEEELARGSARSTLAPPSLYAYPPIMGGLPMTYAEPPYVVEIEEHIPKGTVALKEGAKVVAADGKHVGNVERVLTDAKKNRATHFLISKGILLKEKKMVPISWVDKVTEDQVHLMVRSRILNDLRDYTS